MRLPSCLHAMTKRLLTRLFDLQQSLDRETCQHLFGEYVGNSFFKKLNESGLLTAATYLDGKNRQILIDQIN